MFIMMDLTDDNCWWLFFSLSFRSCINFLSESYNFLKRSIDGEKLLVLFYNSALIVIGLTGFVENPPRLCDISKSDHAFSILYINFILLLPIKQAIKELLNSGYILDNNSLNLNPEVMIFDYKLFFVCKIWALLWDEFRYLISKELHILAPLIIVLLLLWFGEVLVDAT